MTDYGEGGIKVDVRDVFKVDEGDSLEVDISIRAIVPDSVVQRSDVVVRITGAGMLVVDRDLGRATAAEPDDDFDIDGVEADGDLTFTFEPGDGGSQTITESFIIDANQDTDAENEGVLLTIDHQSGLSGTHEAQTKELIIDDDETQTYALELGRREDPVEGDTFMVTIEADPEPVSNPASLTLAVFDQEGNRDRRNYSLSIPTGGEPPTSTSTATLNATNPSIDITVSALTDKNRVMDTITLSAFRGSAAGGAMVASLDIEVADLHTLADADDITATAMDKARGGDEVTEIMEGGDPVYLTISVDRGSGKNSTTTEMLTIDVRPADLSQASDYEVTPTRVTLEDVTRANGKQSTEVEIMLSALSDDDVGDEELVLNLEVSGDPDLGTETSTGTFMITIMDDTEKKVWPLPEAEAYPAILDAIAAAAGEDGLNPGESFSVMTSDLFGMADGYTATYRASVEGGAVSVSASSDTVTVTAGAAGESKVTITATAKMAASSFLPEQTMSDVAHITFAVMVVDDEPEPVPALPLFGQLLLALFMTAGGARLYRRRQG